MLSDIWEATAVCLTKNQFLKLDDYLDEYGSGIKEVLGEEFLKACTNQGSVYALPNNNGKLLQFPLFSGKTLSMSWIFRWIS